MSHKDDPEKLIANHKLRLQKLKEQQALQGISVDSKIPIEIEGIEAEIKKLENKARVRKWLSSRRFLSILPLILFLLVVSSVGYVVIKPTPTATKMASAIAAETTTAEVNETATTIAVATVTAEANQAAEAIAAVEKATIEASATAAKVAEVTKTAAAEANQAAEAIAAVETATVEASATVAKATEVAETATAEASKTGEAIAGAEEATTEASATAAAIALNPTATPMPPVLTEVIASSLNLYSGPGDIYPVTGSVNKGDILTIQSRYGSNDEWIEVVSSNRNIQGWIHNTPDLVRNSGNLNVVQQLIEPPIPPIPLSPPGLLEPVEGASQYRNRMDLSWEEWPVILGPNDYFQVDIWNRYNIKIPWNDDNDFLNKFQGLQIDVAWTKDMRYLREGIYQNGSAQKYEREFYWMITVVRGNSGKLKQWKNFGKDVWDPGTKYEFFSYPSEIRMLNVEPDEKRPPEIEYKEDQEPGEGPVDY